MKHAYRALLCCALGASFVACAPTPTGDAGAVADAAVEVVFDALVDAPSADAEVHVVDVSTADAACLTCIPTSAQAGVSYPAVEAPWPAGVPCLNASRPDGIAKEILMGATRTVVIASPPMEISDEAWATYAPPLPNIKNSDRHLLFQRSCFSRSPSRPAGCAGDACREVVSIGPYTWTALSRVEAADCLPSPAGCAGTRVNPGGLLVVVTRKCHELVFEGSVYMLEGPAGQRAVMHATADGMPRTDVELPAGWALRRQTLSAPLVVHPFGPEGACYYNIIRDALGQSYHQIAYAGPSYP